jgi:hypothetical protein
LDATTIAAVVTAVVQTVGTAVVQTVETMAARHIPHWPGYCQPVCGDLRNGGGAMKQL